VPGAVHVMSRPACRVVTAAVILLLGACAAGPSAVQEGATVDQLVGEHGEIHALDARGEFRAVLCATARQTGGLYPDNRPCEDMLRDVPPEPPLPAGPIDVESAIRPYTVLIVPGLGFDCFGRLVGSPGELIEIIRQLGHDVRIVPVQGLGDTGLNAAIIRDAVAGLDAAARARPLIMVGYSKGTPDILTALVEYPEVASAVSAVVSISGAVGGSPLAEQSSRWTLDLLASIPGSECEKSTETALDSLSPGPRHAWLAAHPLPQNIDYFSLVTWPQQENISTILKGSYKDLAKIDARNDSQVLVTDQVIPGSRLLGFLDADHWAVAVPVNRKHPILGSTFVNHNDFPREILFVALLRYVDQVLTD
jgi:hypothetical protein